MRLVCDFDIDFSAPDPEETAKPKKPRQSKSVPKAQRDYSWLKIETSSADLRLRFPNDLLSSSGPISVDTETTGLAVWFDDEPWMVSMADRDGHSWCVSWAVNPYTRRVEVVQDSRWRYLKKIVEDETITKEYFNAWFDIRNLAKIGIHHRGRIEEVALKARVGNTNEFNYKLKPLSEAKLGLSSDDEAELKKIVNKLRRIAENYGVKIFREEDTTNSEAKKEKAAPDYWLVMYAHLFPEISKEEAERAKELAEEYCRKDTLRTAMLSAYYDERFVLDDLRRKTYEFELEIMPIVDEMETRGVRVYRDVAERERANCLAKAEELTETLRKTTGNPDFNPNSSAQVGNYLFAEPPYGLGLPPTELTSTGQYKTGQKEISHLTYIPFVQQVLECKSNEKAVTLFFDKYLANLQPEKDYEIIHPQVHQNRTRTFRFSMSNPNLQQASNPESSTGENVIQVRNAFGPRPGYVWGLFDYTAQEMRIMGALMKIKAIIDAVANGEDIPTVLGNKTWGGRNNPQALAQVIDSSEFNKGTPSSEKVIEFWREIGFTPGMFKSENEKLIFAEQILRDLAKYDIVKFEKLLGKKTVRTRTKMCMYGKAYGAGANGVMSLLRCNETDARKWLKKLDDTFPEMRKVGNRWSREASEAGFVVNAYGRKIDVPRDRPYVAVDYMIQSTAADMMKVSMKRCREWLKTTGLDVQMILTVHDELIFEILEEHSFKWVWQGIKDRMEDHRAFVDIPISCGISKVTHSWDMETDMDYLFAA
jgi:DNA polymerase I-like protein with 3'-5' exonuclease and polymerase domains